MNRPPDHEDEDLKELLDLEAEGAASGLYEAANKRYDELKAKVEDRLWNAEIKL